MFLKNYLVKTILFFSLIFIAVTATLAQSPSKLGGWYMYFANAQFRTSPFSLHAEVQYRNHKIIGDLEQLLLRSGLQYNLKDKSATFTAGYGYILTQREGAENQSVSENRMYQEALLRQRIGRVFINHRFRFEERFIENRSFCTRYRYALFLNIPLNKKDLSKNAWYLALYNEVFLNGHSKDDLPVFDRNRLYGALGYKIQDQLGIQLGYMSQNFGPSSKEQVQLSVHHNFEL